MSKVNAEQVERVAALIKQLPDTGSGLNFYSFGSGDKEIIASDMYPPLDHPETINFFFFVCLHQFGFWHGDDLGYAKPLVGSINGQSLKGSDLLWQSALRALNTDARLLHPQYLADIGLEELSLKIFFDDNGPIPFPDIEERLRITRRYGRWFIEHKLTPSEIVSAANDQRESLRYFRGAMRQVHGYDQDPLEKKNLLLAMTLANRPEGFLIVRDPDNWQPITDYHMMRVALRLGLVDLSDDELSKNRDRAWVASHTEREIRAAVHSAIESVIRRSGCTMSFIDEKMWSARRYCPEMTEPDCAKCIFGGVCKKRTELFQPILRTTAY